ncbi:MAG TPA: amidohydrolase family protein [Microvirga sp.]|nr:amidohydrolase family protein [Microvirga sp.]
MGDLLVRNVRPMGGAAVDVLVLNGRVAEVGPAIAPVSVPVLDGRGDLLLPGLVEAHTHLDKTMWGMPWLPHQAGPRLIDKIETERRLRRERDIDPERQSERQALQSLRMGSTHIRSHVDVDTEVGLAGVEGVMRMRERLQDRIWVEIVAFPQSGLLVRPGTLDLVRDALRLGAEVVGGLDPCAIDRDPKGHLDAIFGLAESFGRPVDIHLHEPGELGAFSMELIIERTRALGLQGRVVVSHAFCLGMPDRAYARSLMEQLARERIAVMTTGAPSRPVPPLSECVEVGLTVCAGSDGIRDSWSPYGNADMLERAMLIGLRNNLRRDDEIGMALEACTHGGAAALALPDYGIGEGCVADLLLVPGEVPAEAVVTRPANRTVVKNGRVVVRDGQLMMLH